MGEINEQLDVEKDEKEKTYRLIRSKREKYLENLNAKINTVLGQNGVEIDIVTDTPEDSRGFGKTELTVKVDGKEVYSKRGFDIKDSIYSSEEILKHIQNRYSFIKDGGFAREYLELKSKLTSKKFMDVLKRRSTRKKIERLKFRDYLVSEFCVLEGAMDKIGKAIKELGSAEILEGKKRYGELQVAEEKALREFMADKGFIAKQNENTK